jgi:hypothetical protein
MDERGLAPDGFRIPNKDELFNLKNSNLNLNGHRDYADGSLYTVGSYGYYWSSTVNGTNTWYLYFGSGNADMSDSYGRAFGFSVRCLKDNKNTSHDKQTAVEWLDNQLWNLRLKLRGGEISFNLYFEQEVKLIEQAKEMEKQQKIDAYDYHRCIGNFENGEQYYNETYGNKI